VTEFKKEEQGARLRVDFICTNRGQHRPVPLGDSWGGAVIHNRRARNSPTRSPWGDDGSWVGFRDPGQRAVKKDHGQRKLVQYVTTWGPDLMRPEGTEFRCPKCPRNPQKSQEWMETFMAGIRAAGITEVDISRYLD
jgi:hypothetical protein